MITEGQEHYFISAKQNYKALFFECVDITLSALNNRFQNNVIEHLANVENFIIDPKKINTSIITIIMAQILMGQNSNYNAILC